MADDMDEEMSVDTLPLRQDLTCPVCQGIFQDPVLLPCSHSFCLECFKKSLTFSRRCPVCRTSCEEAQAVSNLALRDASDSFLKQNRRTVPHQASEEICKLHLKPLELYCEKDEEPVCVDCVSMHSTHRLYSLKDATHFCKRELSFKVQIFEKKVEKYRKMNKKFKNAIEFIKLQAGQAEKKIKEEFETLHQLLRTEEAKRLEVLSCEEKEKIDALQRMIETTESDIVKLKELLDNVKKEMGNEDLPLVLNFQKTKRESKWTEPEPCLLFDSLLNMGKHVGALSYSIWMDMKSNVAYYPVVMDPNSASPWLSINDDLTSVKESSERLTVPDNQDRFDPCVFILGSEGYTSGKHKWDVSVGDNPKWILGVCIESVTRKKKFTVSSARGVWAISLSKGIYNVLTPDRQVLEVERSPERIRIKLNFDKGEVSFWDAGSEKHLVTLNHKFEEKVYPIFGPGLHTTPMMLCPGKIAVHTS